MFTEYLFQDLPAVPEERERFLLRAVEAYRQSDDFARAVEAQEYFSGRNRAVLNKYVLKADVQQVTDEHGRVRRISRPVRVKGNQLPCGFFRRAVLQLSQYLLSGGVLLENAELKRRLGPGFDRALEQAGESALVQGVCWGFFCDGRLEVFPAAEGSLSGFAPLYDEQSGDIGAGIRFWQLTPERPLYLQLFERDAVTLYTAEPGQPPRPIEKRALRGQKRLPVIPLYANNERQSELTDTIKRKIDAYDNIFSDLGNNLDRANDVYWVLNNFGGQMQQALEVLEQINRLKMVINQTDGMGGGGTAELKTAEVPFMARKTALELLRKELYADFMALDMESLTGGSLTNVAIRAAMADLDLKADGFEWQCFRFVQGVLSLLGAESENISFRRQTISNAHETVQDIYTMRGDIDLRCALRLNPYIDQDEAERLLAGAEKEENKRKKGRNGKEEEETR